MFAKRVLTTTRNKYVPIDVRNASEIPKNRISERALLNTLQSWAAFCSLQRDVHEMDTHRNERRTSRRRNMLFYVIQHA